VRSGTGVITTVVVCSADRPTLRAICDRLVDLGVGPLPATDAEVASLLCRFGRADVLILDLDMPDGAALDLLRERGGDPDCPDLAVLALAPVGEVSRAAGDDRALAVDDLLPRPLDLDHLVHRLEAILRRRHGRHDAVARLGDLVIDPPRHKVTVGDREVKLARKELVLLRVLASDPTRVFSKEELLRDIWGVGPKARSARTLDSHASRLRRKLDPEGRRFVVNCWGVGYRLVESLDDPGPVADGGGEDR
jgi:DNA-binding response OmpR family regulator